MLDMAFPIETEKKDTKMPSLNHSYICSQILRQLFVFDTIEVFTELTLDIDNGLTSDICVFPADIVKPNFFRDIIKLPQMPLISIEVISASQNIQTLLEKSERMIKAGIKTVWTVEPFTRAIFVTTEQGEQIFYNQTISFEGISVDFKKIFNG